MDLLNKRVKHKIFGEGTIVKKESSLIYVHFDSEPEEKRFQYPLCFSTFLKLEDEELAHQEEEYAQKYELQKEMQKTERVKELESRFFEKRVKDGNKSKSVDMRVFSSIEAFVEGYKKVLISEIIHLKKTGGKHQKIFDGICVDYRNEQYIYVFESDDELTYPEGTKINIWQGKESVAGHIISCEDFTITISTSINLGKSIAGLEISAESWRLLNTLNERLDEILSNPSEIVRSLVCDGHKMIEYANTKITTGQEEALQMAQKQPITFIWGPPGTGKTYTLAKIALKHIEVGHRVLMLSYSNVSVDGAILKVKELTPQVSTGVVVRYGHPKIQQVRENPYLYSNNLVLHRYPDLVKEKSRLQKERNSISRGSQKYVDLGHQISKIQNGLIEEERRLVSKARFVATTVSKAMIDSTILHTSFDVVIFDEASMAYIPQIIFAAGLAKKHFVCLGDFRQLPPIVQNDEQSMLNADIFQYCGITHAIDHGKNHKWLCLLDEQRRMHPDIAAFSSNMMYGGRIRSLKEMKGKREIITNQMPMPKQPIAFADLSGMMSVCNKTVDQSRVNVLSAMLSFSLALKAAENDEVGIITPYSAQSRLLHAMARDAEMLCPELKTISCATVHQFQGTEKDVVIYDAVDCYRMPYPGILLSSMNNNYANRLFNVALTRAKGKFISVSNMAYMENKGLSKNLMFAQLIEDQKGRASCRSGEELLIECSSDHGEIMRFFEREEGYQAFLNDIRNARREIRVDIPDKPSGDHLVPLVSLLNALQTKGIKLYIRAENRSTLPDELRPLTVENPFVYNPLVLVDKKTIWFGMPFSDAEFKVGQMYLKTKYRPIIRMHGEHTAKSLYGFMEMGDTMDKSKTADTDARGNINVDKFSRYVLANSKCPECGRPMMLRKSKKGKFFLSCTAYPACNGSSFVNAELVEEYFYRKEETGQKCVRCGHTLEAKVGPYGLYIQCCGQKHHRYKLDEI